MDSNQILMMSVALALGGLIGFLIAFAKNAGLRKQVELYGREIEEKENQLQSMAQQLAAATEAKARAEERSAWVKHTEEKLRDIFQSLASQTLQSNSVQFLRQAQSELQKIVTEVRGDWTAQKGEIKNLVEPLEKSLEQIDTHVRALEQKREGAYGELQEQIRHLVQTNQQLQSSATSLSHALKSSGTRGRWGELQLKRVVELAGMVRHVDFDEQASTDEGRPDMIVHLPNGGILPLDSKVPMDAYLDAIEAKDDQTRNAKMIKYCQVVRDRTRALGQKKYWEQLEQYGRSPEFVIMFVPNESCLCAAFEQDPGLLDYALQQSVLPTTPVTLLAVLKAVAYGWQQHQTSENARLIAEECRELYKRVAKFLEHLSKMGANLDQTVDNFNETVGSLQGRLLPSIRKIKEMANIEAELPDVRHVEAEARTPLVLDEEDREPGLF